jgi:outer membrane receptor protein involved in Fe transport
VGVKQQQWSLQLYAKNLSNSRGILSTSNESLLNPPGGPFNAYYQTPRTLGVSASVGF